MRFFLRGVVLVLAPFLFSRAYGVAQNAAKPPADASPAAVKATALAEQGHCDQALPVLEKSTRVADAELKRRVGLAGVRCSLSLGRTEAALRFLELLTRDFPRDPEVLYAEIHALSDLSTQVSQTLARTAPSSAQARELLAESYEMQGKWDEAEKEYRAIVSQDPKLPGIHLRLGRLLLSKPNPSPTVAEDAKREFTEELAIDPANPAVEYVLGELARQDQSWDEAVAHFSKAAKLDPQFSEAYLGLGISLISLKRYAEATPPLEKAVKLDPRNPNAHYQLGTAYTRAGRKEEGQKEFAIHQQLLKSQGGAADHASPAAPPDGQQ